jgi:Tol biopolymer transport system component
MLRTARSRPLFRRATARAVLPLLALGGLLACASEDAPGDGTTPGVGGDGGLAGDGGGGAATATALRVEPDPIRLVTDGRTRARQTVRVQASLPDGTSREVSLEAGLTVADGRLARVEGDAIVSGLLAGRTRLRAEWGGQVATAELEIRVERSEPVAVPGTAALPADPGTIFDGAPDAPARAPRLVYPNAGVMLPPNLGAIEIHFVPASAADRLFELRVVHPLVTIRRHTRCEPLAEGCVHRLDGDAWALITAAARGTDPVRVELRATDDAGAGVGRADPIELSIAPRDVVGGIYYWTTSNGSKIMRVDFGARDRRPEQYFPFTGNTCYGCHAISPNGRKMSLSERGQWQGQLALIDIAQRRVLLANDDGVREQFQTWSPDSTRIAGIWGDGDPPDTHIRIRDGDTGRVLETIDVGIEPTHPDWSRRGDRIAFTAVTHHYTSQRPGRGGLSFVRHDATSGWGRPEVLIPPQDGVNHYYPAYSPDGAFLVFCKSTCNGGGRYGPECDGDADPSATLMTIPADGGPARVLARANGPGVLDAGRRELSNTFPRWAPFVDARRADGSGRLMWMSFSSRRRYGLRAPAGDNQLLWMAAVDPDAVMAGEDGSFAAFALPFQDLATSNHIAQWTTQIVPGDPDPGPNPGVCLNLGDPCDPANDTCCAGASCIENGPNLYVCRPAL